MRKSDDRGPCPCRAVAGGLGEQCAHYLAQSPITTYGLAVGQLCSYVPLASTLRLMYLEPQLYGVKLGLVRRSYRKQTCFSKGRKTHKVRTVERWKRFSWEVKLSLAFRWKLITGFMPRVLMGDDGRVFPSLRACDSLSFRYLRNIS